MITDKQLFAFTQFVGDTIGKEMKKADIQMLAIRYFGVNPKEARELTIRCTELEYIALTASNYKILTV